MRQDSIASALSREYLLAIAGQTLCNSARRISTVAPLRDLHGNPVLHVALGRQSFQVLRYLLHRGYPRAVTYRDGNTALYIAAQDGNKRAATGLIDAGISVNSINGGGDSPLHIASRIGLPSIVPGMATVEIVGFQGQTAPTTYFEIQTTPTTTYVKINYQLTGSTDSGAVLIFQI